VKRACRVIQQQFWMTEWDILGEGGGKTYSAPPTYFQGVKAPILRIYAPGPRNTRQAGGQSSASHRRSGWWSEVRWRTGSTRRRRQSRRSWRRRRYSATCRRRAVSPTRCRSPSRCRVASRPTLTTAKQHYTHPSYRPIHESVTGFNVHPSTRCSY